MEGHCSTGQSPQWAVVPMEEEEEEEEEEVSVHAVKVYRGSRGIAPVILNFGITR